MNLRGLDLSLVDGIDIVDDDIKDMLALRLEFMALKPEVSPAAALEGFTSWLRAPGSTVGLARDRSGKIQVYIDMNARRFVHRGQSTLLCFGYYIYAALAYRNHPAYTIGNLGNLIVQIRRNRVWPVPHRILWIGPALPTSFVVGARTFPKFWAAGEPDVPPDIAELLDRAVPEIFGQIWLAEERLFDTAVLPPPYTPRSAESAAILARYEARNPNWRAGYAVLSVTPFTAANLAAPVRMAVSQTLFGTRR